MCRKADVIREARNIRFGSNDPNCSEWFDVEADEAEHEALHLVISHRNRRELNARMQEAFLAQAAGCSVLVPAHDGEPEYRCAPGTPLVGSCTGRGFVNGAFYRVTEVGHELIRVLDCLTQETIECSAELLAKHTCLGRSVVYNRAQGLSIADQIVVLHDLSSRYCRRAHLYVGLSRVTDGKNIRIAR